MNALPIEYWILLTNAASTLALTGLIWTVQLVHYPAFHYVSPDDFKAFEAFHRRAISFVVIPLMLAELGTSLVLLQWRPAPIPVVAVILGCLATLLLWVVTFTVQVPLHNRLMNAKNEIAIQRLVTGNWLRTFLWSLRASLVLWMLFAVLINNSAAR